MFRFYTPWKHQKTKSFLTFWGGIEMEHWAKTSLIDFKSLSTLYILIYLVFCRSCCYRTIKYSTEKIQSSFITIKRP